MHRFDSPTFMKLLTLMPHEAPCIIVESRIYCNKKYIVEYFIISFLIHLCHRGIMFSAKRPESRIVNNHSLLEVHIVSKSMTL